MECHTWPSLLRERGDDAIKVRASRNTSTDDYKLHESQIAVGRKEKEAVAFEQDAYNAKLGRLQVLLSCYRNGCNHDAKRFSDEMVRSEASCTAAENIAENEVSHILRGLVLLRNLCVGKHIARARTSINECSSTNVECFIARKTSYTLSCMVNPFLVRGRSTLDAFFLT